MNSKANRLVTDLLGEAWEPTQEHIQFVANLLRIVKDGGHWQVPANGAVYEFDHKNKTITLIHGPVDTIYHRTQAIALKLGYRVLRKEDGGPDDSNHITVTECGPTN